MVITSLENEKIKNVVKLGQKKYRDLTSKYVVEGLHLVEEAISADVVEEIFLVEGSNLDFDILTTYISKEVMNKISTMESSSEVLAICKKKEYNKLIGNKLLLLDDVQDPGNLGTIIRSALSFDVDMIILSNNSVDLYNPKVLRATQGMYNHIPIMRGDLKEVIKDIKTKNIPVYGTNVEDGFDIKNLTSEEKQSFALIMGNEGNGVSIDIQKLCDKNLYIPINKKVESLNVGVACSIILYELGR